MVIGQLNFSNIEHIKEPTLLIKEKDIQQIACGTYHTLILKNNQLFGFGSNLSGQLV